MTMLCNRCELLFAECRPLDGAVCPRPAESLDAERLGPIRPAAVVRCARNGEGAAIVIVEAADFVEVR